MQLETLANALCWTASSALLLFPLLSVLTRRRSLYSLDVMVSALVWIMYFPYLGAVILGIVEPEQGRTETVTTALWFALACNIAWTLGRLFFTRRSTQRNHLLLPESLLVDQQNAALAAKLTKVLLVLGMAGFLFQMLALPNFVFSYRISRTAIISQKNDGLWLLGSYLNLNLLIAVGIATVYRVKNRGLFRVALVLFVATSLATFIQVRSRTFVLAGLFVLLFVFATSSPSKRSTGARGRARGLRPARLFVLAVSIFLTAGILQGARGAIAGGLGEFFSYFRQLDVGAEVQRAFLQEDLAYTKWYLASLELFPEQHPFLGGSSYYVWPLQFVPRSVVPWKPEDTQILFCRVVRPEMASEGGTIPPSIYGDAYINLGYSGWLIFFAFGALLRLVDSYCTSGHRGSIRVGLLIAIIAGAAPHFARGGFHNAMCLVVFVIAVQQLLLFWLGNSRPRGQRRSPLSMMAIPPAGLRVARPRLTRHLGTRS